MSWLKRLRHRLGGRKLRPADIEGMSCPEVVALLLDYVDDELEAPTRAAIEQHVSKGTCECKRALLLELAFTDKVRSTLRRDGAPEALKQRIIEALTS